MILDYHLYTYLPNIYGHGTAKKNTKPSISDPGYAALGVGELLESHGFFKATSLAVFMVGCVWG